jgi:hypothetical protein
MKILSILALVLFVATPSFADNHSAPAATGSAPAEKPAEKKAAKKVKGEEKKEAAPAATPAGH